jgi:CheY-like chemotaxis protein
MTILTVDDNDHVRKLIRTILGSFADTIVECEDGADALSAFLIHQPDLVLMDLRMPRVDGLLATRQILSQFPQARILILTDDASQAVRVAATAAGAKDVFLKRNLSDLESFVRAASE